MHATGRRVGRMLGQLDDLYTLAVVMRDDEAERHPEDPEQADEPLRGMLADLAHDLNAAWLAANKATQRLNALGRAS